MRHPVRQNGTQCTFQSGDTSAQAAVRHPLVIEYAMRRRMRQYVTHFGIACGNMSRTEASRGGAAHKPAEGTTGAMLSKETLFPQNQSHSRKAERDPADYQRVGNGSEEEVVRECPRLAGARAGLLHRAAEADVAVAREVVAMVA
eukprot:3501096-Rhodomonas_salina.1